jgi:alpha-1,3-rhamnosyl/mannosyltransferase
VTVATIRVFVNLLWVAPGRVGGSEDYLARQLLGVDDPELAITLCCTRPFVDTHPVLVDRFPAVTPPGTRDSRALRIAAEHTWLALRTRPADVVHHGGGTAPLVGTDPYVVTIHDLQYRRFPRYFSRTRRAYLGRMIPRSVRRAAIVTTPSAYVRSTVIDAFRADPDRVVVVPHGIPDVEPPGPDEIAAARAETGVGSRPYVVYPAITHPHKGHRVLVEMLDHLPPDLALVLVGGVGPAEPALRAAIEASPHRDRVVRTGRVRSRVRDALLADATVLAFPSEYEGFGAPLVEAMAFGTPVVCSDAAAVREVVGDAAVVVEEATGAAWAAAIGVALDDRDVLVARGTERRRAFTLEESGRALASAYRRAVEVGGRSV